LFTRRQLPNRIARLTTRCHDVTALALHIYIEKGGACSRAGLSGALSDKRLSFPQTALSASREEGSDFSCFCPQHLAEDGIGRKRGGWGRARALRLCHYDIFNFRFRGFSFTELSFIKSPISIDTMESQKV
jgi:hypothetical protein